MDEQLSQLIDSLVSKGASDEEIDVIVKDYQSNQSAPPKPEGDFNIWEANSQALANSPGPFGVIGKGIGDLANTAVSTVTDMIPQTIASLQGKGASQRDKELQGVIARNPELANQQNSWGIGPTLAEEQARAQAGKITAEKEVQLQKNEAAKKLGGVVQNFKDIKSASDVASYIGQALGQAGGQIPLSVATGGASSFLMEAAAVYDEQLDQLAEIHNISREEVIARGLDKPAEGEVYAMLAGGLDAVSAGSVMSLFKSAAGKQAKQSVMKAFLKNFLGEGITEGAQGNLEQLGATQGSGA